MEVEGRTEPMEEGESAKLGVGERTEAGVPEGRGDGAEEDPQDGAGAVGVVVDLGAQALGKGAPGRLRPLTPRV
jgi:hypothetical protein